MAGLNTGLLKSVWKPTLQIVRFRKVNIQKPFPPHFERAKVEHVCKPIMAKSKQKDPSTPLHETCQVGLKYFQKNDVDNQYTTIVAKDLLNWLNHSKLIAFFHMNPMNSDEMYEARLLLKRNGMRLKLHGKEIVSKAVVGTKYEAALSLYQSRTAVAYGPDPNVKDLLKFQKKVSKLILLAAVVDDRFMSRAELEYFASLPDIQTLRAGLVAVLSAPAQGVVRNLNHHQSQLVQHLKTHVDISSQQDKT